MRFGRMALLVAAAIGAAIPAAAQAPMPFHLSTERPSMIVLDGPLAAGDGKRFWEFLAANPAVRRVGLSGPGGVLHDALVVAELVRGYRLDVEVPAGAACAATCVDIFLAGIGRRLDGTIVLAPPEPWTAALGAAGRAALEMEPARLAAYGAPAALLDLRATAPSEGRALTPAEADGFGLARSHGAGEDSVRLIGLYTERQPSLLGDPALTGSREGSLVFRDAGGVVVETRDLLVSWGTRDDAEVVFAFANDGPGVEARFTLMLNYFHHMPRGEPHFGAAMVVTLSDEAYGAAVTALRAVIDGPDATLPLLATPEWDAEPTTALRLTFLAAFVPFTDATLERADAVQIDLALADGRTATATLPLEGAGWSAFARARPRR